jgi:hypothetical protein
MKRKPANRPGRARVVFLFDVDNTLLDNDRVKRAWGPRVTTVFVRQGHYARDPQMLASRPPADVSIRRIGELLGDSLADLLPPPVNTASGRATA